MSNFEKTLLYSSNMWIFADGLLGPLFAVYTTKIGGDVFEITSAYALYLVVTGVLVIVFGRISDSNEKLQKRMLVFGYLLTSLFTFMYVFVTNTFELLFVQIGLGVALALCNPTWYALYDKHSTKGIEGTVWGISDGEGKILTAIAVVAGGFLVAKTSFATLFVVMSLIQLAAALYLMKIFKYRR
jgi:MFS family permease